MAQPSTASVEILYSLVARKQEDGGAAKVTVLSEYATTTGNFQQIARKIVDKVPIKDTKLSFNYETHVFDILIEQGIVYMCMVPMAEKQSKRVPFAFLEDIKGCFRQRYQTRFRTVTPSEVYESFAVILRQKMDYYSKNPNLDKVDKIRSDVAEVKDIMVSNVDELLKRGEKLKILVGKTDDLAREAVTFKKRATELKNKMWWRNCKMILIIAFPIIIGGFWAVFWLCGGIDFCNCQTCVGATPAPAPAKPAPAPAPKPAPAPAPKPAAKPGGKAMALLDGGSVASRETSADAKDVVDAPGLSVSLPAEQDDDLARKEAQARQEASLDDEDIGEALENKHPDEWQHSRDAAAPAA